MFLKLPFTRIANPACISMIAASASLLAWLVPSFGVLRKGFDKPETFGIGPIIILTSWYALIFISFFLGQKLGKTTARLSRWRVDYPPLNSDGAYWLFTALTAIGTSLMVIKIFQVLSPAVALLYLTVGQANMLGEALHENYSIGLVSLRYLVVYSASLSLASVITRKKVTFLNGLNFLMLLMIMTARLILISTILMTIFQLNFNKKSVRVNVVRVFAILLTVFSLLAIVNYSRNVNYYSDRGFSFYGAAFSEMVAYLGAPVQVQIGMTKVLDELVHVDDFGYRPYVDVEEALNANSAFVFLHEQLGFAAWAYIFFMCGFMGFVFSLMSSFGKTAFLLPCGAILYASSELWRLNMFSQGIFITWFVCGLAVPLFLILTRKIRRLLAKLYPVTGSLAGMPNA